MIGSRSLVRLQDARAPSADYAERPQALLQGADKCSDQKQSDDADRGELDGPMISPAALPNAQQVRNGTTCLAKGEGITHASDCSGCVRRSPWSKRPVSDQHILRVWSHTPARRRQGGDLRVTGGGVEQPFQRNLRRVLARCDFPVWRNRLVVCASDSVDANRRRQIQYCTVRQREQFVAGWDTCCGGAKRLTCWTPSKAQSHAFAAARGSRPQDHGDCRSLICSSVWRGGEDCAVRSAHLSIRGDRVGDLAAIVVSVGDGGAFPEKRGDGCQHDEQVAAGVVTKVEHPPTHGPGSFDRAVGRFDIAVSVGGLAGPKDAGQPQDCCSTGLCVAQHMEDGDPLLWKCLIVRGPLSRQARDDPHRDCNRTDDQRSPDRHEVMTKGTSLPSGPPEDG